MDISGAAGAAKANPVQQQQQPEVDAANKPTADKAVARTADGDTQRIDAKNAAVKQQVPASTEQSQSSSPRKAKVSDDISRALTQKATAKSSKPAPKPAEQKESDSDGEEKSASDRNAEAKPKEQAQQVSRDGTPKQEKVEF